MNFNKGDGASFFKILLRDSKDYFPLPTAFANKYLEKCNNKKQTVILKTNSDDKWRVKCMYSKNKDIYCFTNGWLKFMKENGLKNGDFLVFWLKSTSNLTFRVFFYSPDGCLKQYQASCLSKRRTVVSTIGHNSGKKKKKVVEKQETSDYDSTKYGQRQLRKIVGESDLSHMTLTRGFAKVTGIHTYDCVRLKNDEGEWEVRNHSRGRARTPTLVENWPDFIKDNKVKVGDTCVFNHVKGNLFHVRVIKNKKEGPISIEFHKSVKEIDHSHDDHVVAPFTFQDIKVETDSFSEEEEKEWSRNSALEAAESFKSNYPFYKVTIKDSYIRYPILHVPKWFLQRYMSSNECVNCVLEVTDGRKWSPVKYRSYDNDRYGRMYGDKLVKFRDENHLAVNDVCIFELINKAELVLRVNIFRAR